MISVKRIFVAGVVLLFTVLSSSYTGKATQQASDECNEQECEKGLKAYLQANVRGLIIHSLSIKSGEINIEGWCEDAVSIFIAIKTYYYSHPECKCLKGYTVTIYVCPILGVCTLGFRGTLTDPDKRRPPQTVKERPDIIEKLVSADAKRCGVMTKGLRVKFEKDNKGNPFLLVSGEFSALKGSASRGKQTVDCHIIDLVKKYTGGLNVKAPNLKEGSAQR